VSVGIAGTRSTIAKEFQKLVPESENVQLRKLATLGHHHRRYLICTGYLAGRDIRELSLQEQQDTMDLNFVAVAQFCEAVLSKNTRARICVLGSESGFKGSFDQAYAGAKAALHHYVQTTNPSDAEQMLVALAPHIIWDSNMTQEREDVGNMPALGRMNRTKKWLTASEVAKTAHWLLYDAPVSLSGQVIRMRP